MITSFYISRIMQDLQDYAKEIMERDGFISPMLIIISETSLHHLHCLYNIFENIQNIEYSEWINGLQITTFFLHLRDNHDSLLKEDLSRHIASTYSPLAIGMIGDSYYKSMSPDEFDTIIPGALSLNPESLRVLLTRFNIKDNENDFIQISSYHILEKKREDDFNLNDGVSRTVSIFSSPWAISPSNVRIEENINPYLN